ncbi:hypothetical protein D3C72_1706720 [compost metagenome]
MQGEVQTGVIVMQQHHGPTTLGEVPADQGADLAVEVGAQHFRGIVQGGKAQVLAGLAAQLDGRLHGAKGHFIIGRPDQLHLRIAR